MAFKPFKFITDLFKCKMAEEIKNLAPAVKTTVNVANFNAKNTPKWLEQVGNICLVIGAVGGALVLAPVSTPVLVTIGAWSAFAGTVGKILTKMSGRVDIDGNPTMGAKE